MARKGNSFMKHEPSSKNPICQNYSRHTFWYPSGAVYVLGAQLLANAFWKLLLDLSWLFKVTEQEPMAYAAWHGIKHLAPADLFGRIVSNQTTKNLPCQFIIY
jgi:hypothetical protein